MFFPDALREFRVLKSAAGSIGDSAADAGAWPDSISALCWSLGDGSDLNTYIRIRYYSERSTDLRARQTFKIREGVEKLLEKFGRLAPLYGAALCCMIAYRHVGGKRTRLWQISPHWVCYVELRGKVWRPESRAFVCCCSPPFRFKYTTSGRKHW